MTRSAELVPLSPIGIGDFLFDPIAFCGCVNPLVEMEPKGGNSFYFFTLLSSAMASPGCITRSRVLTLRFFSSRLNTSGVPVSTENVP